MPLHPRTLIRRAAIAKCLNKTPAMGSVHNARVESYELKEVPALNVWTGDDEVDEDSIETAPRELEHTLDLTFLCGLKQTDNFVALHDNSLADALDSFALIIEDLISAEDTFALGTPQALAADCVLNRTAKLTIDDKGDQLLGMIELNFRVTYTRHAPVDQPVDIFEFADIRYSLENAVHPDNQAHDELDSLYTP